MQEARLFWLPETPSFQRKIQGNESQNLLHMTIR